MPFCLPANNDTINVSFAMGETKQTSKRDKTSTPRMAQQTPRRENEREKEMEREREEKKTEIDRNRKDRQMLNGSRRSDMFAHEIEALLFDPQTDQNSDKSHKLIL